MAQTHGTGRFELAQLRECGDGTVIEEGVLVFSPGHVLLGAGVYIGHRTMLKGDTRGELVIESGAWVGQDCYINSAGGVRIGSRTGIGPRVIILTSTHRETVFPKPIIDAELEFGPVNIGTGCDIGVGAIILPGAKLADGVQVGAGAVVTGEFSEGSVIAGVPARLLRYRDGVDRTC